MSDMRCSIIATHLQHQGINIKAEAVSYKIPLSDILPDVRSPMHADQVLASTPCSYRAHGRYHADGTEAPRTFLHAQQFHVLLAGGDGDGMHKPLLSPIT